MLFAESPKVFFVLGNTDMRKGIDGLCLEVAAHQGLHVMNGALFVFCGRTRKSIKILYWDRNGFCLFQKKLEKDHFQWPTSRKQVLQMELRELRWLLDGLHPTVEKRHNRLHYSIIK